MTEVILYVATSLDGYIARKDGSIDWLAAVEEGEGQDYGYAQFYSSVDALVMGAKTYDQILGFGQWPYPDKPVYVVTSRELPTQEGVELIRNGVTGIRRALQMSRYNRVWLVGGGMLASSFVQRGWVDQFYLTIMPRILGKGIALFRNVPETELQLSESISFPDGVVTLLYRKSDS